MTLSARRMLPFLRRPHSWGTKKKVKKKNKRVGLFERLRTNVCENEHETCLHELCVRKVTILPVIQEDQIEGFHPKLLLYLGDQVTRRTFD